MSAALDSDAQDGASGYPGAGRHDEAATINLCAGSYNSH
jgi:hypothetical protein